MSFFYMKLINCYSHAMQEKTPTDFKIYEVPTMPGGASNFL